MLIVNPWMRVLEMLVQYDDPERALKIYDEMLPAHWRDGQQPKEIKQFIDLVRSKVFTPNDYVHNTKDAPATDDQANMFLAHVPRAQIIHQDLKQMKKPVIYDLGTGDFCLPIGLKLSGIDCYYKGIGLTPHYEDQVKDRIPSPPPSVTEGDSIFLAFEIIEHLPDVNEIRNHFLRLPKPIKRVYLSTPNRCYRDGHPNWLVTGLPHLRTYTPGEFMYTVSKMFPEYKFQFVDGESMHMVGELQ